MDNIKEVAPEILDAFFGLTGAINNFSPLDIKTKELILIGVFTTHGALRGLETHTRRALEYGVTKDEIVSAIFYTLPVIGISSVTSALGKALEIINESTSEK